MSNTMKKAGALMVAAALFAGCSGTATPASQSASSEPKTQTSAADSTIHSEISTAIDSTVKGSSQDALLNKLMSASDDDAKARDVWMDIFDKTAGQYMNTFELEGDGEIYEYTTDDDSGFVDNHFLYETSMQTLLSDGAADLYSAQYRVVDDSYDNFESGTGLLMRTGDNSTAFTAALSETGLDLIKGTVKDVRTPKLSRKDLPAMLIYDGLFTDGYMRSVDPVNNASLYAFDLQEDHDGYVLNISVKDIDTFRKQASTAAMITLTDDNRPALVLDEATGETWRVKFNRSGILEEVDSNIFHANILEDGKDTNDKVYINLRAKNEVDHFDDARQFVAAFNPLMDKIQDGSLKAGSEFTLED